MLGTSPTEWAINGLLWLLVIRFVLWPFIIAPLLDWLDYRRQQKVERIAYEIIPHHLSSVPADAATEFFKILHTQFAVQSYEDHLLRRKQLLICELVSVREGIHYIVRVPKNSVTEFERFEASESAQRVLGQAKSTINFEDIMDSGKILICNFSKGGLGEDTATLFGTTVLAKLQLAAWRREDAIEEERRPFYVYVDEFQNFASQSFMGFFSEARKYKVFVTMAQQSVSQLSEQNMLNTILDNVGTIVAFRSKSKATEELLLHQFRPYIEQGDILNLPSYSFYAKIAATDPQEPVSGRTIVLPKDEASEDVAQKTIKESRERYAIEFANTPTRIVNAEQQGPRRSEDHPAIEESGEGLPGLA